MNLGDILKSVFGTILSPVADLFPAHTVVGSWIRSQTGHGLTGAQLEANQFSHNEAQLSYERALQADSTKHQREVADLQAAGLNPMLATGMSGGSVQSSAASSVSPSAVGANLGDLLGAVLRSRELRIQKKVADSEVAVNEAREDDLRASAAEKRSRTTGQDLYNDFFSQTSNIRAILLGDQHERNLWERNIGERGVAVKEAAQALAEKSAEHYNALLDSQKELIDKEVSNYDLKAALFAANAREANANVTYKMAMLEVDKRYKEAATESEKNSAELLALEARLKNGVYTPEYIKAVGQAAKAETDMKETLAAYERGDYSRASASLRKMFQKLEKEGTVRSNVTFFDTTERGADAANALPLR